MNDSISSNTTPPNPAMPSRKAQSWGALISIIVIVLMIVGGAFYSWGKRIAETNTIPPSGTVAQ